MYLKDYYLCGLQYDMTEGSLRELCELFGDIKKVVVHPCKRIAFVEYLDLTRAEGAKSTLKSSLIQRRRIDAHYSRGNCDSHSKDTNI